MPKEITHWYLARRVREALRTSDPEGSPRTLYPFISHCIESAPNLYLLGAVGPDFLFYYLGGAELQRFRGAAMVLHGRDGGNTFRPLTLIAESFDAGKAGNVPVSPGMAAFLIGYLVHVASDAAFHPFVLYTVGRGAGRSQYEHHVLESVLDLYVLDKWGRDLQLPQKLKQLTQGMEVQGEMSREDFLKLLGWVSFLGEAYNHQALKQCLRRFEKVQGLFWSPLGSFGARVLKTIKKELAFFEASFYQPRFWKYCPAFDNVLDYHHPVSGVHRSIRFQDLVKDSIEGALSHAAKLEQMVHRLLAHRDGSPIESVAPSALGTLEGPNLETGIFGDTADKIIYTRPEGLEGLFGPFGYRYK